MGSLLNMSRGSLRSLDWAGLAKALIDPTIPFDITGFEVNPMSGVLYNKPNLTGTVTIKSGVTEIGSQAFHNCRNITGVSIPEGITTVSAGCFGYCYEITSIVFPSTCINFEFNTGRQFAECYKLESVNFPEGTTRVPTYVFLDCTALKHIILPQSTLVIGGGAFQNSGIEDIVIPSNVTTVLASAFFSGKKLKEVIMEPTTPPTLGKNAFSTSYVLESIYVPDASVNAYKTADNWNTYESYIKPISERVV